MLSLLLVAHWGASHPTATRASGVGGVPVDMDWVSRRVKRHLNDLERSNYTEPTSGPGAYGQVEDAEEAKGPTALGKDEDGGLLLHAACYPS